MKRILFAIVPLIAIIAAKAEILEEGKVWIYEVRDITQIWERDSTGNFITHYMVDTVDGDTIIDNRKCTRIRHENLYDEKPWWSDEEVFWTYEYEEGGRVYRYDESGIGSSSGFKLLMDFNLQVGDSVTITYEKQEWKSVVYEINEIPVGHVAWGKRLWIEDDFSGVHCWVEHVGLFDDRGEYLYNFEKTGATRQLRKCYKDGELIFSYNEDIVSNDGINDVTTDSEESAPIYDLMGLRVEHPQRGGLYIRGGKKFIWQE